MYKTVYDPDVQEWATSSIKTELHASCLINNSISTIEHMSRDQGITG